MSRRLSSIDGATADQVRAAVLRLAVDVVGAAYEEAMRTHGIMPDSVKVVSAKARANLDALDDAHTATLNR